MIRCTYPYGYGPCGHPAAAAAVAARLDRVDTFPDPYSVSTAS
jgi:hypothetical protein